MNDLNALYQQLINLGPVGWVIGGMLGVYFLYKFRNQQPPRLPPSDTPTAVGAVRSSKFSAAESLFDLHAQVNAAVEAERQRLNDELAKLPGTPASGFPK